MTVTHGLYVVTCSSSRMMKCTSVERGLRIVARLWKNAEAYVIASRVKHLKKRRTDLFPSERNRGGSVRELPFMGEEYGKPNVGRRGSPFTTNGSLGKSSGIIKSNVRDITVAILLWSRVFIDYIPRSLGRVPWYRRPLGCCKRRSLKKESSDVLELYFE